MTSIILTLLPFLIQGAEALFGPKKGADKKADVKTAINGLVAGIATVSRGGQANTWKAVETILSAPMTPEGKDIIDVTAELLFPPTTAPGDASGTGAQSEG